MVYDTLQNHNFKNYEKSTDVIQSGIITLKDINLN